MSKSIIIDNQVVSLDSNIFSIRPVNHLTPQSQSRIPAMTWGSTQLDKCVISLLLSNDININDLNTLTPEMIKTKIKERYDYVYNDNDNK